METLNFLQVGVNEVCDLSHPGCRPAPVQCPLRQAQCLTINCWFQYIFWWQGVHLLVRLTPIVLVEAFLIIFDIIPCTKNTLYIESTRTTCFILLKLHLSTSVGISWTDWVQPYHTGHTRFIIIQIYPLGNNSSRSISTAMQVTPISIFLANLPPTFPHPFPHYLPF